MNVMSIEYEQEIKHSREISKVDNACKHYSILIFILKHLYVLPRAANEERKTCTQHALMTQQKISSMCDVAVPYLTYCAVLQKFHP